MGEFSMIPESTEYKEFRYRWVILLVYCFENAMNSMLWITFSPITTETHKVILTNRLMELMSFELRCVLYYLCLYIRF
ncbi:unnamed protein product [Blepharisma stoltei]|uniref:Uncharacterized protein n=1 Tax=Blepharisma stoltei TaxID=1481888 RepID=A0AAU9JIF9_9CILI|nr:unnamed protein product [Blepharisma stoltei]